MKAYYFLLFIIPVVISLAVALPTGNLAFAQPTNDNFANAINIPPTLFEDGQDLTSATLETGEPKPSCRETGDHTIWYAFIPPSNGIANARIEFPEYFSGFLAVYTGNDLQNLIESNCFDYVWEAGFNVQAGTIYYIQVGSISQDASVLNFRFEFTAAPPNDAIANALTVTEPSYSDSQDLTAATYDQISEPFPSCAQDNFNPSRTIWYVYSPSETGAAIGNVQKDFAAFMAVYRGNDLASFTEVGCWEWIENFGFSVQKGETYYIQIGSRYEPRYGPVQFNFEFLPPPPNDNFVGAINFSDDHFHTELNILSATLEEGEPTPSCSNWEFTSSHTVWYAYTPSASGLARYDIHGEYGSFLAVYTGPDLLHLDEIDCFYQSRDSDFNVQANETYYLQIGSPSENAGNITIGLDLITPPPNDNFSDARKVFVGDSVTLDNSAASTEPDEPSSGCASYWYGFHHTVWFYYEPDNDGFVSAYQNNRWFFLAAYTGSSLNNLSEIDCRTDTWDPLPIRVSAGNTYYFQVGTRYTFDYGEFTFELMETPQPETDFGWSPIDPNAFDNLEFCDWTNDPVNAGISEYRWDFGDGATSTENCTYHQFGADGDYTVFHNITTSDGRTDPDGMTKPVSVRTHDVAITKVTAPLSASARQTRAITVDVKNTRYPENVRLVLYKSVVGGYQEVSYLIQYVPVRAGNRTTRFTFNYTFTPEDAALGKVTFKAVAEIQDARDAFPADNEAVSTPPTKVTGKPAAAAEAAPSPQ